MDHDALRIAKAGFAARIDRMAAEGDRMAGRVWLDRAAELQRSARADGLDRLADLVDSLAVLVARRGDRLTCRASLACLREALTLDEIAPDALPTLIAPLAARHMC